MQQAGPATSLGILLHQQPWDVQENGERGSGAAQEMQPMRGFTSAGRNPEYSQATAENRRQVRFGFKISIYIKHLVNGF